MGNSRINIYRLYKAIIQAALANWQEERLYLSLDTSLFWDKYCLIRLAVVHQGHALPLAWRVLEHESTSVAFSDYRQLLTGATPHLPAEVNVTLLADRGFGHTEPMQMATAQLGWQ